MALERELILLLARDFVFLCDEFAGVAHVEVFVDVPQAIIDHRVEDFRIAEAEAGARAFQQVRAIRHRFHAAGNDDFGFSERDALRGQRDGFEAGAANFVDRHRCDARIEAAAESRLARGILSQTCLDDIAHDGFVHLLGLDTCAADGFGDNFRAKFGS